ncbi:hypothetical protein BKA67DRAFT_580215 [Truncatella angustata]|uniref:Uncharacterized protein n=1 Tax=Truncatella angustata TaxID=152316 RepID=A0A9P8RIW7_9PEZI|nr:uncharacterized protein BKA67DRAFT_580215 [Truncatella angustata]KAH6646679.1 hypothetical protein BKA67DRAFT_580215 [Truncatella angustata]
MMINLCLILLTNFGILDKSVGLSITALPLYIVNQSYYDALHQLTVGPAGTIISRRTLFVEYQVYFDILAPQYNHVICGNVCPLRDYGERGLAMIHQGNFPTSCRS